MQLGVKQITLIRHGQSTYNAHYERTGRDPGHRDARLTDHGRGQAKAAAQRLAAEPFDLIVTSPLSRALQTTQIIFSGRQIPVLVQSLHREWLEGPAEVGRSPLDLAQDFPQWDFAHLADPWWHHDPRSKAAYSLEPHGDFISRVQAFRHWVNTHSAQRMAIVGHATFFSNLVGRWLDNCEAATFERV